VNCPRCQTKAARQDRYCRKCGAPLGALSEGLEEAALRFHRGDYSGALDLLKSELQRRPDDAQLVSWIGHAHYFSGRESEARESYARALALDPGLWDALYQQAALDFAKGSFLASAQGFSQAAEAECALKGHPLEALFGGHVRQARASAWLYAGLSHKELGQTVLAVDALKKASNLDSGNPLPWGVLADLHMGAQDFEAAAAAYEEALSKVKDDAGLLALRNDLGVALFRAGKLERAAEEFKKVIQVDPKNSNAIYNLGVLYLKQGLGEGMKDDLREFLKADDAEHILLGLTRSMVDAARSQGGDQERAGILGRSRAIGEVLDLVRRAASSDATVLLLGENGTGKEMVARAIHLNGPRRDKPFVAVNCGALPETLLESELFGYEKGAFTGAATAKPGRFELAEGGTLFLDEIGDLKLSLQVKLLRAIQEKSYERLGGTKTLKSDIRIIAATHRDLRQKVVSGEFREDLFYRLYVVPISLPPLRERKEDIPILAQHFLERNSAKAGKRFSGIEPAALEKLISYPWPGNVRELENVLERAVAIYDDTSLRPEHLQFDALTAGPVLALPQARTIAPAQVVSLEDAEREVIVRQLKQAQFKVPVAAKALGLSRATLYRKLLKYHIPVSEDLSQN
jgi:DNA-binding NtrC family response regulator/Tfp pilus assembly protein PilF